MQINKSVILFILCVIFSSNREGGGGVNAASLISNCPPLAPHNTTTIRDLRPNDIKVIMAIGDSVAAGFAMMGSMNEYKGKAYVSGADAGVMTLNNLFKMFSPTISGGPRGLKAASPCNGNTCPLTTYYPTTDNLNAAFSGANIFDYLKSQSDYLINQVIQTPEINTNEDWKVLTISFGKDDMCAACQLGTAFLSSIDFYTNLLATLEKIRLNIPRTFVNIVLDMSASTIANVASSSSFCSSIDRTTFVECQCIFDQDSAAIRSQMDYLISQYNTQVQQVAEYYKTKDYDSFAVIVHTFASSGDFRDVGLNNIFSTFDCYHPSQATHAAFAVALWNSMLTPSASKKHYTSYTDTPICPSSSTKLYIY